MLRRLWTLFRREIAASRGPLLLVAGLIVLWDLFLVTRIGKWHETAWGPLSFWPIFLLLPCTLLLSFQNWHREWQQGTVHYTLAFPLPGWLLVLTKGLAALAETLFLGVVALLAGWPLYGRLLFPQLEDLGSGVFWQLAVIGVLKLGLIAGLLFLALSVVVQCAYLAGKLAGKLQGLVMPLAALSGVWLVLRGGGLLHPALGWVPPAVFALPVRIGRVYRIMPQFLGLAPVVSAALFGVLFWGLAGWLAERQVDI
jgi:hypothetical protein